MRQKALGGEKLLKRDNLVVQSVYRLLATTNCPFSVQQSAAAGEISMMKKRNRKIISHCESPLNVNNLIITTVRM